MTKLLYAGSIPAQASMKVPPKRRGAYVFDNAQDRRIFRKLTQFHSHKLTKQDEKLIKFLYSQLERNWRTPLEKFIDNLLK